MPQAEGGAIGCRGAPLCHSVTSPPAKRGRGDPEHLPAQSGGRWESDSFEDSYGNRSYFEKSGRRFSRNAFLPSLASSDR